MEDMSQELMVATQHANRILDWHENLVSDDLPPQWMWHVEHELSDWFEEVEAKRNNRFQSDDDDDDSSDSLIVQNDFAKERR